MSQRKLVVAVGGASGAIYAQVLFEKLVSLRDQWQTIGVVMSRNAHYNWQQELGMPFQAHDWPFDFFQNNQFEAPFASGSARYDTMIICPCSAGLMGRIAAGTSIDLTSRAADVMLKERRKLILVLRETPLSLIHIRNMEHITLAGGIICPAIPSFYSHPASPKELAATVVDRVLDLAGFTLQTFRWGDSPPPT